MSTPTRRGGLLATWSRWLAAAVALRSRAALGDFNLGALDPSKIASTIHDAASGAPDLGKIAAGVKQAATDAQNAGVGKVADTIRDAAGKEMAHAKETIGDIVGAAVDNSTSIGDVAKTAMKEIGEEAANHAAGDVLPPSVAGVVQEAADKAANAAGMAKNDAENALKSGAQTLSANGVNAGAVASAVGSTGQQVGDVISKGAPTAAQVIRQKGETQHPGEAGKPPPDSEDDDDGSVGGLGVMWIALGTAGLCGCVAYRQLQKRDARTASGLLADGDIGMQLRGGALQAPGGPDEPYFRQF